MIQLLRKKGLGWRFEKMFANQNSNLSAKDVNGEINIG